MSSLQGPPTGLAESPDSALRPAPSPAALRSLCALPRLAPGALLLSRRPFSPTPVKFSPAKLFCGGVPKSQTVVQRQVLRRLAPARFSDRFSGRLPLQQAGVRAGAEMGGSSLSSLRDFSKERNSVGAQVFLFNKGRQGAGRRLKPFAIRETSPRQK